MIGTVDFETSERVLPFSNPADTSMFEKFWIFVFAFIERFRDSPGASGPTVSTKLNPLLSGNCKAYVCFELPGRRGLSLVETVGPLAPGDLEIFR